MYYEKCDKAHIYYRNKNNDKTFYEIITYDESFAQLLRAKIVRILNAKTPPEKKKVFACRWCDFNEICHGKQLPRLNCRNCIHATPSPNGDARWLCEKNNKDLSEDEQKEGCGNHLLLPEIYNSEVISYDKEAETITYKDGMKNTNNPDGKNCFGIVPF